MDYLARNGLLYDLQTPVCNYPWSKIGLPANKTRGAPGILVRSHSVSIARK